MSSRSFRRRNNRRRQRGTPEAADQGKRQAGPQEARLPREQQQGKASQQGQGEPQRTAGQRRDARQRQGGRQSPGKPADKLPQLPPTPIVVPDCPVCGKPVRELASALTHRASKQPAHFECVARELRESNEIGPNEKLYYLGGGSFGILEFRPPGGPGKFVIRKRIQYEEKETPQDWKKQLQVPC